MIGRVALLDSNVLYSATVRDITLQLARDGMIQVRWTGAIQDEWTSALIRRSPQVKPASIHRTRQIMDRQIRGALVSGYEHIIDTLDLPDPDDQHVLAAAIWAECDVLVTFNLKHFPPAALNEHGLGSASPDEFLVQQLRSRRLGFLTSVRHVLSRLCDPPYSVGEYLINLHRAGLHTTSSELSRWANLLD